MFKKFKFCIVIAAVAIAMCPMTALAKGNITLCNISGDSVNVTASMGAAEASSDNNYYLVGVKPYQNSISEGEVLGSAAKKTNVMLSGPLCNGTTESHLYDKFYVCVKDGNGYKAVTDEAYITNPEAIAQFTTPNPKRSSKKGATGDVTALDIIYDMGCQHVLYDLELAYFFRGGETIDYEYNGKTYHFSKATVDSYDTTVKEWSQNGLEVTMQIVNTLMAGREYLTTPGGRVPGYRHYGWNVAEQQGMETIAALLNFLGARYSNIGCGTVSNWIIGNEVNNNNPWHFVGDKSVSGFCAEYEKEFRVAYNAIKSANGNARVLTCIDQRWTWEDGTANQYGCKYFLDNFNSLVKSHGNIDWGLAAHPHPLPLTCPRFWDIPDSYKTMNLLSNDASTRMVTPINMKVMTNYISQSTFRNPEGNVRYLSLSEMLFNSQSHSVPASEELQAAALAYAFKLADANPVIQAFIIHRPVDSAYEVAHDDIACGLWNSDSNSKPTTPKPAYDVAKYMDTKDAAEHCDKYLSVIGASSWPEIIK